MRPYDWIDKRLIETNGILNCTESLYKEFRDEVESEASFDSFKRMIRKRRRRLEENGEIIIEASQYETNYTSRLYTESDGVSAEGKVSEIKDPDEMLKDWGIDTNKWGVEDCKITRQTIYGEDRKGELEWEDGRISDGNIVYSGRSVNYIYHVKLKLYRKIIDDVENVALKPISISPSSYSYVGKHTLPNNNYKTCVVLGDAQMGFKRNEQTGKLEPLHDRKAMDIAIKIIEYVRPDSVVILGDMLDLTEWSDKFLNSPEFERTTQPTLNELSWWLHQIKESAGYESDLYYMAGNHEDRLPRIIIKNQKTLFGLRRVDDLDGFPVVSVPHWLALDSMGYTWLGDYPKEQFWLNDNICISHSEKNRTNINTIMNQVTHIEIIGHVHKFFNHMRTLHTRQGIKYAGLVSFGALAHNGGIVPSKGSREDWQKGLGVVRYSENNMLPPSIDPVFIDNNCAIFEGKLFKGEDNSKQISKDIDWVGYI